MGIGHCGDYIFKIGSLVVLHGYEVDESSSAVHENHGNRLEPMIEIQVTGYT